MSVISNVLEILDSGAHTLLFPDDEGPEPEGPDVEGPELEGPAPNEPPLESESLSESEIIVSLCVFILEL